MPQVNPTTLVVWPTIVQAAERFGITLVGDYNYNCCTMQWNGESDIWTSNITTLFLWSNSEPPFRELHNEIQDRLNDPDYTFADLKEYLDMTEGSKDYKETAEDIWPVIVEIARTVNIELYPSDWTNAVLLSKWFSRTTDQRLLGNLDALFDWRSSSGISLSRLHEAFAFRYGSGYTLADLAAKIRPKKGKQYLLF